MGFLDLIFSFKSYVLNYFQHHPFKTLRNVIFSIIAVKIIKYFYQKFSNAKLQIHYKIIASKILKERNEKMRKFVEDHRNEVSDDLINKIINVSLVELKSLLKNKEITSRQIVIAYSIRNYEIALKLNLIADANFEIALADADKADIAMNTIKNSDEWPELLGLPLSIKDHIGVKGFKSTCGMVALCNNIDTEDGILVKVLREKGAIPLVKTNVPQGLLSMCSSNNLYGEAKNPWNLLLTPGGSSGGEAALLASKCSAGGIGSDMLGSIIIPSSWNGIYGLRTTPKRIGNCGGILPSGGKYRGFSQINPVYGPMCRFSEDIVLLAMNMLGAYGEDIDVKNKPFDNEAFTSTKKLKIGYIINQDFCEVATSILDGLEDCKKKLAEKGHELVPFPIEKFLQLFYKTLELVSGAKTILYIVDGLKGEKPYYYLNEMVQLAKLKSWQKSMLYYVCYYTGMKREFNFLKNTKHIESAEDLLIAFKDHNQLKDEFYKMWKNEGFDAVLSPGIAIPAVKLDKADAAPKVSHFTVVFNSLEMPGVSIPIGLVENTTIKPIYNDKTFNIIKDSVEGSKGLPVSVQVSAMTNNDEICLRLMKEIDEIYKFSSKHSPKLNLEEFNKK